MYTYKAVLSMIEGSFQKPNAIHATPVVSKVISKNEQASFGRSSQDRFVSTIVGLVGQGMI